MQLKTLPKKMLNMYDNKNLFCCLQTITINDLIMKKLLIGILCLNLILSCSKNDYQEQDPCVGNLRSNGLQTLKSSRDEICLSDIAGTWAENEILFMKKNGFVYGYCDGTFRPGNEINRGEFADMISYCIDPEIIEGNENISFSDIDDHWAKKEILKAVKAGFLSGFEDGTFRPDERITKAELVVSIAKGMQLSGGNVDRLDAYYDDANNIPAIVKSAIANATDNKIVVNYPDKRIFSPESNATRAQAVAILYRVMMSKGTATNYNNIYLVNHGFNVNYPNPVKKGEEVTFSGKTADISKVKFYIDGNPLYTVYPENSSYSFNYEFNDAGEDRALKIELYQNNDVVEEIEKSITVNSNTDIITSRQQYDEAVGTTVYNLQDRNGFFFEADMTIDADGSPHAYHPDNTGLDYLGNAGYPGNWWGIATDSEGNPYIQLSTDPAPGYYVSTTALCDTRYSISDPRRYADAENIPYIVLPAYKSMGAKLGDYCVIYNQKNGSYCFAIYADVGPTNHLGEASIKAAELLGIPSSPKYGGQYGDVIYLVFPGTRLQAGRIPTNSTIQTEAARHFEEWGGIEQLEYFYK